MASSELEHKHEHGGPSGAENAVAGQIRDIIAALNDIRAQLADQNKYLDVLTEKYIHKPSRQVYFLDEDEDWDEEEDENGPLTPESLHYSRNSDSTRLNRFKDGSIEYESDAEFHIPPVFGHLEDCTPIRGDPVLLDPFTTVREEARETYFDCLSRPIVYGGHDDNAWYQPRKDRVQHSSPQESSIVRRADEALSERLSIEEVKNLRHSLSNATLARPLLRRNSLAELGGQRNRYILVFIVATGLSLPIGCVANSFGIRPCVPNSGLAASQWPFIARFLVLFVVTYFTTATCALWFVRDGDWSQDMLGFWKPRRMTTGSTFDRKALMPEEPNDKTNS
ncbi:hypothetical protein BDV12DRAFT_179780 [Aspergillus spectabilis]